MNWMKHLYLYFVISALVIIPGVFSLFKNGLKLSVEFTGGSHLSIQNATLSAETVIKAFNDYAPTLETSQPGNLVLKTKTLSQNQIDQIITSLKAQDAKLSLAEFETIGPALGQETLKKTINALLLASVVLLAYISYAFKQIKYGLCAVLAMFHDTAVLMGSFSLLGYFYGIQVDLLFVTAVLTILSFSVHDTIVVYDRIRELSHQHKNQNYVDLVNQAVTETMGRSLNNSLTIIFMLLAMYLIGGETTKYFALALLIGTVTGTYSSTFTAAPLLVLWEKFRKH